jgi:hypothetical protein
MSRWNFEIRNLLEEYNSKMRCTCPDDGAPCLYCRSDMAIKDFDDNLPGPEPQPLPSTQDFLNAMKEITDSPSCMNCAEYTNRMIVNNKCPTCDDKLSNWKPITKVQGDTVHVCACSEPDYGADFHCLRCGGAMPELF